MAFEKKIEYIVNFYKDFHGKLDGEYPYFTKSDMDDFVEKAVCEIQPKLQAVLNGEGFATSDDAAKRRTEVYCDE